MKNHAHAYAGHGEHPPPGGGGKMQMQSLGPAEKTSPQRPFHGDDADDYRRRNDPDWRHGRLFYHYLVLTHHFLDLFFQNR